jgi:hypothetical protein
MREKMIPSQVKQRQMIGTSMKHQVDLSTEQLERNMHLKKQQKK